MYFNNDQPGGVKGAQVETKAAASAHNEGTGSCGTRPRAGRVRPAPSISADPTPPEHSQTHTEPESGNVRETDNVSS